MATTRLTSDATTVLTMAEHVASIEVVEGDITTELVDAIVNAANSSLLGGGGVDGAIHQAAGPRLLAECREVRHTAYPDGLPVGQAVATGAGDLPARWVIHTVGPNRHAGQTDPALLASCFEASLGEAVRVGARSVAFPAISAGVYGYPGPDAARVSVAALRGATTRVEVVHLVAYDAAMHGWWTDALAR